MRTTNHRRVRSNSRRNSASMREVYEKTRGPAPSRIPSRNKPQLKSFFKIFMVLTLMAGVAICYPLFKKQNPKIGYVNATELAMKMGLLEEARQKLELSQNEWDSELLKFYREFGSSLETFEIKKSSQSQATQEKMQQNVEQNRKKLEAHVKAIEAKSEYLEQQLKAELVQKLKKEIQSWGDKNGYDVLHTVSAKNKILNTLPELDVTQELQRSLVAVR